MKFEVTSQLVAAMAAPDWIITPYCEKKSMMQWVTLEWLEPKPHTPMANPKIIELVMSSPPAGEEPSPTCTPKLFMPVPVNWQFETRLLTVSFAGDDAVLSEYAY